MATTIKAPSAERIANEVGGVLKHLYDTEGLTCFRKVYTAGDSGQLLVKEGYLEYNHLPNGKVIVTEKVTKVLTVEEAELNE